MSDGLAMRDATKASRPSGPVGAALIVTTQAASLRCFGMAAGLLQVHEDAATFAVVLGHLHYRAEAAGNDAAFAARLFAQRGLEGLRLLEGEFALLIFDKRERRTYALRDPTGGYPLFWLRREGLFAIATAMQMLKPFLPSMRLDTAYFAEFMTLPYAEMDHTDLAPFEGLRRLSAGAALVATATREPVVHRPAAWADQVEDPGPCTLEEAGARFGHLLREATRERLIGRTGAHLSGGMDSTSTALIAAALAQGEPVHALSLIYESFRDLAAETPYVDSALGAPGLVAHRIPADDVLDFDGFDRLPAYDEPFSGLYRTGTDRVMIATAKATGCRTILTGIGADEYLDGAPFHLADCLKGGDLAGAWRQAATWALTFSTSPWRVLKTFALTPLLPPRLQPGVAIPSWVLPDFAARGQMRARILERLAASTRSAPRIALSDIVGRLRLGCGDWVRAHLGAPDGIHIAHPFRDPRVIRFAMGARLRFPPRPQEPKALLGAAMGGLLPEMIRTRVDKGHFNALYYAGLARNADRLERLVAASPVDELGFFDKPGLIAALRETSLAYRPLASKISLDNALTIAQWTGQFARWGATAPDPGVILIHDLAA